jgi:hypothetical protein
VISREQARPVRAEVESLLHFHETTGSPDGEDPAEAH